jgi:hypothetical protein
MNCLWKWGLAERAAGQVEGLVKVDGWKAVVIQSTVWEWMVMAKLSGLG